MSILPQKVCTRCELPLPATADYFHRGSAKYGLASTCKACKNAATAARVAANPEKRREQGRLTNEKRRDKIRAWHESHRDHIREQKRARHQANRAQALLRFAEYRKQNPDKLRALDKAYYRANADRLKQKAATWHRAHPDRRRVYDARARKRRPDYFRAKGQAERARRKNAAGAFTAADIQAQYQQQQGLCFWCHRDVGAHYHADHYIPLARGGTNYPDNIVISCPPCNTSRRDRLASEWSGCRSARE